MAPRAKTWVCGRSLAEISGSNPAEGMDVCLLWLLCVDRLEVSASGWSLVQMNPSECGVSERDREAWTLRRTWITRGCLAIGRKSLIYCFTCILSSWSSLTPSFGQYSRTSWWWMLWLKFYREMFFTAGFSAKLSNLVLQLSEQQKRFGSYLAQYPFLRRVFVSVRVVTNYFPSALSCPSVRVLQRHPLDRFPRNLLFATSIKNLWRRSRIAYIRTEGPSTLHENLSAFFCCFAT